MAHPPGSQRNTHTGDWAGLGRAWSSKPQKEGKFTNRKLALGVDEEPVFLEGLRCSGQHSVEQMRTSGYKEGDPFHRLWVDKPVSGHRCGPLGKGPLFT